MNSDEFYSNFIYLSLMGIKQNIINTFIYYFIKIEMPKKIHY